MSLRTGLLAFGLAAIASLSDSPDARASYSYSNIITPGSISGALGTSVTFSSVSGTGLPVDGSITAIRSVDVTVATSDTSQSGTTLTPTLVTDVLKITDGGLTGSFTITTTFTGTGINTSGGGSYDFSTPNVSASSIVVNGDRFTLTDFGFIHPVANGSPGFATISVLATPAAVPEPSSIALCGIAGAVGLVIARRRRKQSA
jgi:hypothetical protein